MDKDTFKILSAILEDKGLLHPTQNFNADEQLFIFLTIVEQCQTNRESQDAWQYSGKMVSRWFTVVLNALCTLKSKFIKPPTMIEFRNLYGPMGINTDRGLMYVPKFIFQSK